MKQLCVICEFWVSDSVGVGYSLIDSLEGLNKILFTYLSQTG